MNNYLNYIDGRDVAAADGRTFTAFNPTTGAVWGTFALAGPDEVDRAVTAASAAFRGPWGALSPTRRGRLLMKWGEKIAEHADRIAAIETGQNGKLFAEMRAQARTVQDWLYYFGGLAGQDRRRGHPARSADDLQLHAARAARRRRRHHAVELADLHRGDVAGAGARRRQHHRAEAVGDHVGVRDRAGAAGRGVRHPAGRRQRRHRLSRDRRGAGRSSAGGEGVVHRQRRRRAARSRRARVSVWSAACSSSAARARTSCSPTRTSIRPRRACWPASSRPPGRRASPARARTSSSRFTTSSSTAWCSGRRRSRSAIRCSPRRRWDRSRRRCSSRRTSRW